jgi:hypothetical protein
MHLDRDVLENMGLDEDEIVDLNKQTVVLVDQFFAKKRKCELAASKTKYPAEEIKA